MSSAPRQIVTAENGADLHRFACESMATVFEIAIAGQDAGYARQAAAAAFARLHDLEGELSRFIDTSDVARINALALGESVRVGVAVFECLQLAAAVCADTAGAFDVTVGYGGTGTAGLVLGQDDLTVGLTADRVRVDLGGIGKGYAIDQIAALLREWGIEDGLVHGGQSTVCAIGDGPWSLALRDPRDPEQQVGTIALAGASVSGSSMELYGAHIIDPRTGQPPAGRLAAWAKAPSAALSDALSTAFMVMDEAKIERYCAAHPDAACIIAAEPDGALKRWGEW